MKIETEKVVYYQLFPYLYGAEDLRANGFNPKNVSQVITGVKFSHGGYKFLDFKLPKEEKEKYIPLIDITTKI